MEVPEKYLSGQVVVDKAGFREFSKWLDTQIPFTDPILIKNFSYSIKGPYDDALSKITDLLDTEKEFVLENELFFVLFLSSICSNRYLNNTQHIVEVLYNVLEAADSVDLKCLNLILNLLIAIRPIQGILRVVELLINFASIDMVLPIVLNIAKAATSHVPFQFLEDFVINVTFSQEQLDMVRTLAEGLIEAKDKYALQWRKILNLLSVAKKTLSPPVSPTPFVHSPRKEDVESEVKYAFEKSTDKVQFIIDKASDLGLLEEYHSGIHKAAIRAMCKVKESESTPIFNIVTHMNALGEPESIFTLYKEVMNMPWCNESVVDICYQDFFMRLKKEIKTKLDLPPTLIEFRSEQYDLDVETIFGYLSNWDTAYQGVVGVWRKLKGDKISQDELFENYLSLDPPFRHFLITGLSSLVMNEKMFEFNRIIQTMKERINDPKPYVAAVDTVQCKMQKILSQASPRRRISADSNFLTMVSTTI